MGLKITKTDAYILKDLIPVAIVANIFIVVILQSSTIVEVAPTLLLYNVPPLLSIRIILDTIPPILGLSLPLSGLIATLVVYSRMSADNETVSMLSLGMGKWDLFRPVLFLAGGMMSITAFSTFYLAPLGGKDIFAVAQYSINNNVFRDVQPKVTYTHLPSLQFYVDEVDEGNTFKNVRIGVKNQPLVISSKRADFEFNRGLLVFMLDEGGLVWYDDVGDTSANTHSVDSFPGLSYVSFEKMVYTQSVLQPDTVLGGESVGYRSTGELINQWHTGDTAEAKLELSKRTASIFAVLIMSILGTVYGVFHSRNSKMRLMLYAAGVILSYYGLQTVGTGVALWVQTLPMFASKGDVDYGIASTAILYTTPLVLPWLANITLGIFSVIKVRGMLS